MIIFLGIIGELATVIGSIAITYKAVLDSVLEISKKGYKLDEKVLNKYLRKEIKGEKQKENIAKKLLGTILLLVPGVNLINSSVNSAKLKKGCINDPQIKKAIVPMTEKEKEQYERMDTKMKKLTCALFNSMKENDEKEFFGFIGKSPIVVDHGLTSLYYEELIPLNYTLDEVKRLNEATTYSYRIGKVDGKNVAIIGIPNPNSPVSRIHFEGEDYKITHTYEKMTEEEAEDKTFIVYPFTIHDDTQADIEKVIQDIKSSRMDSATKSNLDALQYQSVVPGVEIGYAESETPLEDRMYFMEDSIFDTLSEEQGLVMKKTLNSQNNK